MSFQLGEGSPSPEVAHTCGILEVGHIWVLGPRLPGGAMPRDPMSHGKEPPDAGNQGNDLQTPS